MLDTDTAYALHLADQAERAAVRAEPVITEVTLEALITARFYTTLVREGVPPETAAVMTREWHSWGIPGKLWLRRCDESA